MRVVQKAFAATDGEAGGEAGAGEPTAPPESPVEDRVNLPPVVETPEAPIEVVGPSVAQPSTVNFQPPLDPLPARMLNEFVYCPRLFYYEHVEGVFVESADTVKGKVLHKRVDKGSFMRHILRIFCRYRRLLSIGVSDALLIA